MTAQLAKRCDLGHDANGHSLWSTLLSPIMLRCHVVSFRLMLLHFRLLPRVQCECKYAGA